MSDETYYPKHPPTVYTEEQVAALRAALEECREAVRVVLNRTDPVEWPELTWKQTLDKCRDALARANEVLG